MKTWKYMTSILLVGWANIFVHVHHFYHLESGVMAGKMKRTMTTKVQSLTKMNALETLNREYSMHSKLWRTYHQHIHILKPHSNRVRDKSIRYAVNYTDFVAYVNSMIWVLNTDAMLHAKKRSRKYTHIMCSTISIALQISKRYMHARLIIIMLCYIISIQSFFAIDGNVSIHAQHRWAYYKLKKSSILRKAFLHSKEW